MASVLHIRVTLQALKGATKEGNGFRQANGTPKSWGQGVHIHTHTPSAHALQLLGTDSGSLRDARIISCLTLISTRGENRHSRALKCTKTHTKMNTLLDPCTQKHPRTHTQPSLTNPHSYTFPH